MKPWLSKKSVPNRELPLQRDDTARFVPWIMAVMVFLLALSSALALATQNAFQAWDRSLSSSITVQIPVPSATERKSLSAEERVQTIVDFLRQTDGVERVQPVDPREAMDLLATWLGEGNMRAELPVPRLVDFVIAANAELDLTELQEQMAKLVPGTQLDDHKLWLDDLLTFGEKLALAAGLVAVTVALATLLMIIFATRSGLVTHHPTIELLHIMGARNGYIARQFGQKSFVLGFGGGVFGLVLALLLTYAMGNAFADVADGLLPSWYLTPWQMAAIGGLPLIAGVLAMGTSYVTVLYKLSRIV